MEKEQRDAIYSESYPILIAPWFGIKIPIQVRRLGESVHLACGDFSLIKDFSRHLKDRVPTIREMNAYAERMDEICRLTLVNPNYDELFEIAGAHVPHSEIRKQLLEIKNKVEGLPPGPEKKKLTDEYEALEVTSKFILPPNFMSFVTHYATGQDQNDIDDMTEEMLFNCAILAHRGKDNPSDHFPGRITPRVKREFDNRAWVLFDEKTKKKGK